MSTPSRGRAFNQLIAMLPQSARLRILAHCDEVDLTFATNMGDAGARIRHVHFPLQGFISLVTPSRDCDALEVGLVGNEGMHGVSLALGVDVFPFHAMVQGTGTALRMSAADFRREHARTPELQRALGRYVRVLLSQYAQRGACMRFHRVEARLARWLLMTQDRAHADSFQITHAFLAWMLGVRRASVSDAALALQLRGLIAYKRGRMTILNRRALEVLACNCYASDRALYQDTMMQRRVARKRATAR
ncbi:MAG: Crp/Fnr family transcriptional regulator [Casimicrobiaceae bacterium]